MKKMIESLMKARRFDEALRKMEETEQEAWGAELWVLRGKCLQLAEGTALPLEEAKRSFQRALELDGRCLEAWIELGYYVLCVEDNARDAECIFRRALQALPERERELSAGLRQCQEELAAMEAEANGRNQ